MNQQKISNFTNISDVLCLLLSIKRSFFSFLFFCLLNDRRGPVSTLVSVQKTLDREPDEGMHIGY